MDGLLRWWLLMRLLWFRVGYPKQMWLPGEWRNGMPLKMIRSLSGLQKVPAVRL